MSKNNKREKQADQRRRWQKRRRERMESEVGEKQVIFNGQTKDGMEFQVFGTVYEDGTESIDYNFGPPISENEFAITVSADWAHPDMVEAFESSQVAKGRSSQ